MPRNDLTRHRAGRTDNWDRSSGLGCQDVVVAGTRAGSDEPRVQVEVRYDDAADRWFWLRQPLDGTDADPVRQRIAAIFEPLPPTAFMLVDPTVATMSASPIGLVGFARRLPDEIAGVAFPRILVDLSACLDDAPPVPPERRSLVADRIGPLDRELLGQALQWIAAELGFEVASRSDGPIDVAVVAVADGVTFGGVTAEINDRARPFVAVVPHPESTLAEAVLHEATHALDVSRASGASWIDDLRHEHGSASQVWHVPFFLTAAEAVRRFIDPQHRDYGDTHGYYAKVPDELTLLRSRPAERR